MDTSHSFCAGIGSRRNTEDTLQEAGAKGGSNLQSQLRALLSPPQTHPIPRVFKTLERDLCRPVFGSLLGLEVRVLEGGWPAGDPGGLTGKCRTPGYSSVSAQ